MALSPERDAYHLVYLTLLALGMAMLLSWNAFISSPDYVKQYYKYAAKDPNATTAMPKVWADIENYIAIGSMIPNLIGQSIVITKFGRSLSMHSRMIVSILVNIVCLLVVLILPAIGVNERVAFGIFMTAVVVCGFATAFFQSTVFGLAGSFP